MWGRELRAGLVFVLASVALGGAFRAWERAHHERLDEIVAALSEGEAALAMARTRAAPAGAAADTTRDGSPEDGASARVARSAHVSAPDAAPPRPASIDPDRATRDEWLRLPGIGPTLAARILADRAAHGPFGGPEGLLRVPGIGPKTLAKIQVYLRPSAGFAPGDSAVRDRAK
jgi:DNA uptake protein ComE-like DNA-binding protein